PYRFAEWRRGEGVRVVANPDYHNGRPALDEVEFKVVPDLADALDRLKRGAVDFVTQDVPCERYDELAESRGIKLASGSGNALNHVTFNFDRAPWADRRVREAVSRAVDRERLAKAVCPRAEPAAHAYLQRVEWAFDATATFPEYDSRKATSLLAAAGLRPGADGVRVRGRMVCRQLFPFHVRLAQELALALAKVGIVVRVDRLDATQWKEQVQEGHDFDLLVDGLGIGPDPVFLEEMLASESVLNVGHYRNAELDELFRKGKATHDLAERGAAYKAAQAIVVRDMPRIHLIRHVNHHGYRSRWSGWSWDPSIRGTIPFWDLERIRRSSDRGSESGVQP
ncbi:MAG: ABC transporter substrate-binding protein, partial [Thermoleophilaceae bacterium]